MGAPLRLSTTELFNPIVGISEGEIKKYKVRRELKENLTKSQKSSQSRSRSKSKLSKLIEKRREAMEHYEEGIIGQMKRFEATHGKSSPSASVLRDMQKTFEEISPKRSQNRRVSRSKSVENMPHLGGQAYASDNLAAINL